MDHEKLKELVFLSYDRALSPADQLEVGRHLAECSDCRAALASWKNTSALLFPATKISSPDFFVQSVMSRIEADAPKQRQSVLAGLRAAFAPRRWALAGAMALAIAAVFISHPLKTNYHASEATIEYASDLMDGPFAYAETEEAEEHTAIEEYFLS